MNKKEFKTSIYTKQCEGISKAMIFFYELHLQSIRASWSFREKTYMNKIITVIIFKKMMSHDKKKLEYISQMFAYYIRSR